jgi:hypothetical protein
LGQEQGLLSQGKISLLGIALNLKAFKQKDKGGLKAKQKLLSF